MPTGYTATLMDKGQDFRTFTLTCARAFGACIMQRDDPMDQPPKKQDADGYHAPKVAEATAELARLNAMTSDERFDFGSKRKTEALTRAAEYLQSERAQNDRLDAMMGRVVSWKPPTSEHAGLKAFMIEQLTISRHNLKYATDSLTAATKKDGRDYYNDAIAAAQHDIEYHRKEAAKEQERNAGRNEWIEQLQRSLP